MRRGIELRLIAVGGLVVPLTTALAAPVVPVPTLEAAVEIGVTPHSLIVSGVTIAEVPNVLSRVDEADDLRATLASARANIDASEAARVEVQQLLLVEPEDPELLAQLETTSAELGLYEDVYAFTRQTLIVHAFEGISQESVALLLEWSTHAELMVPPAFRSSARTTQEWEAIQRALRAEARATRTGIALGSVHANLLAEIRSTPAVVAAEHNLAVLTTDVQLVFAEYDHN